VGVEAVGHALGDVDGQLLAAALLEDGVLALGGGADAGVDQHRGDLALLDEPQVGLAAVVVEAAQDLGLGVRPVALEHRGGKRQPRAAVGLEEPPALVGVDLWTDQPDARDLGRFDDVRHCCPPPSPDGAVE
jgi:hypothetical protein